MSPALDLVMPDQLRRQVLVAVACIDPFTGRTISAGLEVAAAGLTHKPLVNRSGHFVWCDEGAARPAWFDVAPKTAPYQPMTVAAPSLPPTGAVGERLLRVMLQPTGNYPFPDDAVVVRGRLLQTAGGAAVTDARVRLQWKDDADAWIDGPTVFLTGPDGRFAVGLVTAPGAQPTATSPPLLVRLAATRAGITKVTPEARMAPGAQAPPPGAATPTGEVAWDALQLP